jgi:hypothetical protein
MEDEANATRTPVGVTIAYQRRLRQAQRSVVMGEERAAVSSTPSSSPPRQKKKHSTASKTRTVSSARVQPQNITKPVSSWSVFWQGASLYVACLILPAVLGTLWRRVEHAYYYYHYHPTTTAIPATTTFGTPTSYLYERVYSWYDSSIQYICQTERVVHDSTTTSTLSWLWSHSGTATMAAAVCPMVYTPVVVVQQPTHLLVLDHAHDDVWTVAALAVVLAVVRLFLTQSLMSGTPDQLAAMVRCKSIHLLSSDYSQTPMATPVVKRRVLLGADVVLSARQLHFFPDGSKEEQKHPERQKPEQQQHRTEEELEAIRKTDHRHNDSSQNLGLGIDELSDRDLLDSMLVEGRFSPTEQGFHDDKLEDEGYDTIDDDDHDDDIAAADLLLLQSLAAAWETPRSTTTESAATRLYSAPRYATAQFRLLYCTAATGMAWYSFRDANFWPWYVGGTGSTAHCWDLSGGLTVGMDSDFDQRNEVLKRYFLWQASYHWHSGAFHILSMLLLLLHPPPASSEPTNGSSYRDGSWTWRQHHGWRFGAVKTNTSAYVRSLLQHLLALVLIATAYVFSSLRRLAAIGMFAFDVSSWFLHLLQVCINAPNDDDDNNNKSPIQVINRFLRRPVTITRIHRYLVLPTFCYTRLLCWPALWYSCVTESKHWLQQLEQTLWAGSAQQLRWFFHIWLVLLLGMTAVYFQRLIHHPHLQRVYEVLRTQQQQQKKKDGGKINYE